MLLKCLLYTCITLICFLVVSARNVSYSTDLKWNELVNSAIQIANDNFDYRRTTAFLSRDAQEVFANSFLKSYKGSVIIETKKDNSPPTQIVMILESFESFLKILNNITPGLKGERILTSSAKILIVLYSDVEKLDRIFKILWSYHALNVLVVSKTSKILELFTYYPYKNHRNCQDITPKNIRENLVKKQGAFPDKLKNMNQCPLYISTDKLYHPATEQKVPLQIIKKTIVSLLRHVLNFTPIVTTRDYVTIDSDRAKNWSNSLNDVISEYANISTCSIPLGADRLGLLDYSRPYSGMRLAWIGPPVKIEYLWWRLVSPLNSYLWLDLIFVLIIITLIPYVIKLQFIDQFCRRCFKKIHKLKAVPFRTWGIMLGQPVQVAPKRFRDFYIISLWIWFTFVIRSAYQSVLIVSLKRDTVFGDFVNLKEAVDNGYKLGGRAGILAHFEQDSFIRDGFVVIPEADFENIFQGVIEGRIEFILATSLEYVWAYCMAQGIEESECGHVLPDSILTVPLVVWVKIHSAFSKPISLWLPRLIESGLLEQEAVKKPSCCSLKTPDETPLNHNQILSCILTLLVGYFLSAVVFLLELLHRKTILLRNYIKVHFRFILPKKSHRDHVPFMN